MKKPTQEQILSIKDGDPNVTKTKLWKNQVNLNIKEIKLRKQKGQEFRDWHCNNNNENVVTFYEIVKRQRGIQDSDSRKSAEFWF